MKENSKVYEIVPKGKWYDLHLKEIWEYRDLVFLFVKRSFVSKYKQTVLGPAWAIIQPLLTTVVFTLVFGNLAGLPVDGMPSFLFYLGSNIVWSYFSSSFTQTSTTFVTNSSIMGKVYFPRLIMPLSTVIENFITFGIQFAFFIIFLVIYGVNPANNIHPNLWVLITPFLLIQMALLSMGFGIIVSALTTKYRDLSMLVSFGVQLWMYATPVAYSASMITENVSKAVSIIYNLNPMTPIVTTFRYAFMGSGTLDLPFLLISLLTTVVVLFVGIIIFSRVERTFMDTV